MRFLFVVDEYSPKTSANTVCVQNLQRVLKARNIFSDVICYGDTNGMSKESEFGQVYTIPYKRRTGFFRSIQFIKNIIIWPLRSLSRTYFYFTAIKYLTRKYKYDAIIGVVRPLEGAVACSFFDNFILYELDSIGNNSENLYDIRKYIAYRSFNVERFLYNRARYIFHMQSHELFYTQGRYDSYKYKSEFLDLPGLSTRYMNEERFDVEGTDYLNIVYTGNLWKSIRSPKYFLDLLIEAITYLERTIKINFYSQGDCGEIIKVGVDKGIAIDNGYVSNTMIPGILSRADFLLNIGNSFSGKVTSFPSKTIEYIATGKPIIHIDGGENDSATEYIKRYPNSIIIYPEEKFETNVLRLVDFIKNNYCKIVPFDVAKSLFFKNTPEYTIERIINVLGK